MIARCGGEALIAREQRSVEGFGKCNLDCVIGRKIAPQLPDPRQEEIVPISAQGKVRKVAESSAAAFVVDLARRRIPADHLRDFDVEQMWRVQRLRGSNSRRSTVRAAGVRRSNSSRAERSTAITGGRVHREPSARA